MLVVGSLPNSFTEETFHQAIIKFDVWFKILRKRKESQSRCLVSGRHRLPTSITGLGSYEIFIVEAGIAATIYGVTALCLR